MAQNSARAKIAIIGMGGIFPDASNAKTFWQNIVNGHVAIREVPKDRWDPELFWSADRSVPDKTYSRIGGWIRDFAFDAKRFRIPPATLPAIDTVQRLALTAVAEALTDAGLEAIPGSGQGRPFDRSRTAAIMGNAMGGEQEDRTSLRCWFPLVAKALIGTSSMQKLAMDQQKAVLADLERAYKATLPTVTEDSMAGELSNCITGRIANSLDINGANFTTDAACASSMAALKAGVDQLRAGDVDIVVVGGADQMMDPPAYIKFSKIGALSAEKSAPFDATANGFVMGEGVGVVILKRLEDAERDGDKIYAVITGVGGSSDGKGKGIMAPNPKGQRLALERAYADAGADINTVSLFEAHGTSTVVGDQTEVGVITELLRQNGQAPRGVPVGSVKSMIGHLKAAAGIASLIKVANALHDKVLPPSAGFKSAPTTSALNEGYLVVNTTTRRWESTVQRRAGVSSFGFGGINFHAVLEEYVPGGATRVAQGTSGTMTTQSSGSMGYTAKAESGSAVKANVKDLIVELQKLFAEKTGYEIADLEPTYALEADLGIDTVKQAEVMGVVRERYGLAREESFKLSDTPTLAKVAEYIASRIGATAAAAPTTASPQTAQPQSVQPQTAQPQADHRDPGSVIGDPKSASMMPTTSWTVVLFGADSVAAVGELAQAKLAAETSWPPACAAENAKYLRSPVRVAFASENLEDARKKAADVGKRKARVLAAQGIFVSETAPIADKGKMAFLFPGQGSQFLGMFKDLAGQYPIVAETFREADKVLTPLLGKPLTDICWAKADTDDEVAKAELALRQTEVCQPAMLTADVALYRLLAQYGVKPDVVAGHSLGEYAACVASGVLSFPDALYAVSARGREMAHVKVADNGKMATVATGAHKVEPVIKDVPGYVIAANKNCHAQTVIAGESASVVEAINRFTTLGIEAREIPVSHAFHSAIVAPAAKPLRKVLSALNINAPRIPLICNVDATYYPTAKEAIVEVMAKQLESPVEFIGQVERMYADGARLFVEVGPRRAVTGFVRNILDEKEYQAVATNHHKKPAIDTVMEALAALMCEGVAVGFGGESALASTEVREASASVSADIGGANAKAMITPNSTPVSTPSTHAVGGAEMPSHLGTATHRGIVVSGCSIIVPSETPIDGVGDDTIGRMLGGENFITSLSDQARHDILDRNVARLDKGAGSFEPLRQVSEVIQLAARVGKVDLVKDYGVDPHFDDALDRTSQLAIAAGIDALRDAGLPLSRRYRQTSTGKMLPDRWALPAELAKGTGVVFGAAFPGVDRLIDEVSRHIASKQAGRAAHYLRDLARELGSTTPGAQKLIAKATELDGEAALYQFNRKFLFRVLAMGHAQLAQTILAQGPNTQVNAACASGTQAIGIASDWIANGRCDRVVVVTADDVTQESMLPWFAAGFLAAGAATVEADVTKAAVPFGAGRNGMILGAGAAAFVLERDSSVAARGMVPLVDVVATHIGNSAFHGTRLDSTYIRDAFAEVVTEVAKTHGLSTKELAEKSFFMSHETYTPARGGSSAAEIDAIRHAFADSADKILIANTKGYTGHPMGASLEDVVAIKALQRREIPAIANLNDIDPAFTGLRFSRGEKANVDFAIHFAAGFGSQVAMAVFKRRAEHEARLLDAATYKAWLAKHAGRDDAGLEVVARTLRVAEKGGVAVHELGIPSLALVPKAASKAVTAKAAAPKRDVNRDQILLEIRALFAEKTGYELGDLDPAFLLEADLGIDTVKQAEIMSIIREKYGFAKDENFKLAQVQTLNAVVDYVVTRLTASDPAPRSAFGGGAVEIAAAGAVGEPDGTERLSFESTEAAPRTGSRAGSAARSRDDVFAEIQALFAEKTGYELSDLDPTFQLEADLGIDTVKQAEIMSIIREKNGFAKDESFKLSQVPTLNAVVDYVLGRLGEGTPPTPPPPTPPGNRAEAPVASAPESMRVAPVVSQKSREEVFAEVRTLFAEKTGYELADLEPTFQLEADLGIDTVKQAEIMSIIRERYSLAKDESFKLAQVQTIDAVVDYVLAGLKAVPTAKPTEGAQSPKSGAAATKASVAAPSKAKLSLRNEIVEAQGFAARTVTARELPALKAARSLAGRHVVLAGTDTVFRQAMREALLAQGANVHVVQPEALSDADLEAHFADLGGGQPADDLVSLVSEHSTISVSAIEAEVARSTRLARAFARGRKSMKNAGLIFAGRSNGIFGMHSVEASGLVMGALSGIAKSLAKEWPEAKCGAYDLDRTESLPQSAKRALDAWMSAGPTEIAVYKGALWTLGQDAIADAQDAGLPAGAVVVASGGARGVTFELVREIASTQALKVVLLARTGGVAKADSPIHGKSDAEQKDLAKAALTQDGKRATPAEVKRWIETEKIKLEITENLEALKALGAEVELKLCDVGDLRALGVVTDAIKAKYGHVDLLVHGAGREESKFLADKDAEAFERVFAPKARAGLSLYIALKPKRMLTMGSVAGRFGNAGQADYAAANELLAALSRSEGRDIVNVDWTAWGDVGMATKESVKHVLVSSGVEFLPAKIGARLGAALALSSFKGDVVVAGELGLFAPADKTPTAPAKHEAVKPAIPQIFDRMDGAVYVRRIDPKRDIGIDHHRIDGVAVLPGVIGLEMMTEAAMHASGREASRLENVNFSSPVKIHRDDPMDVRVEVSVKDDTAQAVLVSEMTTPNGKIIRREHFTTTVVFGQRSELQGPAIRRLEMPRDPGIDRPAIYKRYFHGPVFQVLGKVNVLGEDGVEAASITPWPTWLTGIGHNGLASMPFARETAFQAAGLWEMAEFSRMALPAGIERVELGAPLPEGTEVTVEARRLSSSASGCVFDVWTRDASGKIHDVMRGYRTVNYRPLTPEERFEPTYRRELTPNWLSVEIDEIQASLAHDETATLKQYLAPQEQTRFKELKTEKRKIDWLAGRIVAKRLIRESHFAREGAIVPYSAINIVPDELGAPQVTIVGESKVSQRISISHSAGCAAAMLSVEPGVRPGIDVETIEPRAPAFMQDYFTDVERQASQGHDQSTFFTSIWAVKEAVVKALGIGARVDLREIQAVPRRDGGAETWHVTLTGEALQRAETLGAGAPRVELETMANRVVARVLMPVNEQRAANAGRDKPEISA